MCLEELFFSGEMGDCRLFPLKKIRNHVFLRYQRTNLWLALRRGGISGKIILAFHATFVLETIINSENCLSNRTEL